MMCGDYCYSRECARCGDVIQLQDGCDWPAGEDDTYCWECMWLLVGELRQGIEALRSQAEKALDLWDCDRDAKVGKLLKSLAGLQPGYSAVIDQALVLRGPEPVV